VDALGEFFRQSLWRFSSSTANHSKPFYFYALPVLSRLMPWTLLFFFMLWLRLGSAKWREGFSLRGSERFPAIWFVVVILGLSAASAKRHLYLAPIYPAFALLCALWWGRVRERYDIGRRTELSLVALWVAGFVALRLTVFIPQDEQAIWSPMMASVRQEARDGDLVLYRPIEGVRGAAVFYLGKTTPVAENPEELSRHLAGLDRPAVILVVDGDLGEIREGVGSKTLVTESSWKVERSLYHVVRVVAPAGGEIGG
jgi:4-amino-4-deoxy-L-arabinose transferase-like glycosyltransferase